jgi:hypothetical protein
LLFESLRSTDKETQKPRGFLVAAQKVTMADRKNLPARLARHPLLECCDLQYFYSLHLAAACEPIASLLDFFDSNEKIKSVFFCYLF